jgi:hypothetical protein
MPSKIIVLSRQDSLWENARPSKCEALSSTASTARKEENNVLFKKEDCFS